MAKRKNQDKSVQGGSPSANAVLKAKLIQLQQSTSFSGPLPHPEILERYNSAVPGGAERIIAMAEKQSDHRMRLESSALSPAWKLLRFHAAPSSTSTILFNTSSGSMAPRHFVPGFELE